MYGIYQELRISHNAHLKSLKLYVYHPSSTHPGLWKHNSRTIKFTLVVDDFGVKYSRKEHTLHLKNTGKLKKVTTEWEGEQYIGIAIKWDY